MVIDMFSGVFGLSSNVIRCMSYETFHAPTWSKILKCDFAFRSNNQFKKGIVFLLKHVFVDINDSVFTTAYQFALLYILEGIFAMSEFFDRCKDCLKELG